MSNLQAFGIVVALMAAGAALAWIGLEGSAVVRAGAGGLVAGVAATFVFGLLFADAE